MPTILIEKNVMVPLRDGVRLATDVYRLKGAGPTPVLVVRTPYNKDGLVAGGNTFDVLRAVQAGYTVVAQDVRGRYASEGAFNPHVQETDDGLDAFAWAAAQPWSNRVIGTFGGSYLGGIQWLPARENPPAFCPQDIDIPDVMEKFAQVIANMAQRGPPLRPAKPAASAK
jgi:putative CocE/NonD family hydrolase